jgi:tRNA G37 N-methylase Trm5
MRHLSVPSHETERWLALCRSNGWLSNTGVVALEEGLRAVPLNASAPEDTAAVWEGNPVVNVEPRSKGPAHWRERLPAELQTLPESVWPSAYEIQGDVLMVKVESPTAPHEKAMAQAMLDQLPNVRLVCADDGVEGAFRVRQLRPLLSRDGSDSARTQIKEHGVSMWVDPSKVYFSARLSTQRHQTLEALRRFRSVLNRPLVLADPYAGVGPSLPLLLAEPALLQGYLAGDLNPDAVDLLAMNIARWTAELDAFEPAVIVCDNALNWAERPDLVGKADVLLVNLPHDSLDHLPHLMPLFRKADRSLLRGWAIVERDTLEACAAQIRDAVKRSNGRCEAVSVEEIKGFSSTRCFVVFQTTIAWD